MQFDQTEAAFLEVKLLALQVQIQVHDVQIGHPLLLRIAVENDVVVEEADLRFEENGPLQNGVLDEQGSVLLEDENEVKGNENHVALLSAVSLQLHSQNVLFGSGLHVVLELLLRKKAIFDQTHQLSSLQVENQQLDHPLVDSN